MKIIVEHVRVFARNAVVKVVLNVKQDIKFKVEIVSLNVIVDNTLVYQLKLARNVLVNA